MGWEWLPHRFKHKKAIFNKLKKTIDFSAFICYYISRKRKCAPSSADRVPGYEPVGREFESPGARHKQKRQDLLLSFLFISPWGESALLCDLSQIEFASKAKPSGSLLTSGAPKLFLLAKSLSTGRA